MTARAEKKASPVRNPKPVGNSMAFPGLVAEQKRMLAARGKGAVVVSRIANSSTKGKYKGSGPDGSDHRVGANDFLKIPSRMGDGLHYRRDSGVKK